MSDLVVKDSAPPASPFESHSFEMSQRQAKALAESDLVPQQFKGKVANCLVALELAHRLNDSPLAVMQNLNIVHGKPGWSAQWIIGKINSSRRFEPLQFKYGVDGEVKAGARTVKNETCLAFARDRENGVLVSGPVVSIATAVAEGWYGRSGSKWPAMPGLMLSYRAATFFGRLHCPEILLGMQSVDEIRDVGPSAETRARAAEAQARIAAREVES